MGKYSSQLENYFNTTPSEILDQDYKELEYFNDVEVSVANFQEQTQSTE